MFAVKLALLTVTFLSFASYGLIKSNNVKKRVAQLEKINTALFDFAEKMRYAKSDLGALITECFFECPFLIFGENGVTQNGFLNSGDMSLLREFFDGCGSLDRESEYKRAVLYISLFSKRYEDAAKECEKESRLFKTAGISIGLAAVIMLI